MSRASDSSKLVVLDPRDIPKRPDGKFAKGFTKPRTYGRKKGTPNKTTVMLKQAILDAAALVGQDGKGKDGLVGYLKMLAVKERPVYARLLERVLPLQLNVEDKSAPKYTASEAVERLRARKLPVPLSLQQMAEGLRPVDDNAAYERELNGDDFCDTSAEEPDGDGET